MEIFHQQVDEDRQRLGLSRSQFDRRPASYITVHRSRILEDGYAQLSVLPVEALKGTVRVKFINEQVFNNYLYVLICHIHVQCSMCVV